MCVYVCARDCRWPAFHCSSSESSELPEADKKFCMCIILTSPRLFFTPSSCRLSLIIYIPTSISRSSRRDVEPPHYLMSQTVCLDSHEHFFHSEITWNSPSLRLTYPFQTHPLLVILCFRVSFELFNPPSPVMLDPVSCMHVKLHTHVEEFRPSHPQSHLAASS